MSTVSCAFPVVKIVAETRVRKSCHRRGCKSKRLAVVERVIAEYPLTDEKQLPILNQWSLLAAELVEAGRRRMVGHCSA